MSSLRVSRGELGRRDPGPRPLAVPKAREREARLLSKTQKCVLLFSAESGEVEDMGLPGRPQFTPDPRL